MTEKKQSLLSVVCHKIIAGQRKLIQTWIVLMFDPPKLWKDGQFLSQRDQMPFITSKGLEDGEFYVKHFLSDQKIYLNKKY